MIKVNIEREFFKRQDTINRKKLTNRDRKQDESTPRNNISNLKELWGKKWKNRDSELDKSRHGKKMWKAMQFMTDKKELKTETGPR